MVSMRRASRERGKEGMGDMIVEVLFQTCAAKDVKDDSVERGGSIALPSTLLPMVFGNPVNSAADCKPGWTTTAAWHVCSSWRSVAPRGLFRRRLEGLDGACGRT